jgi:hypothetical protein
VSGGDRSVFNIGIKICPFIKSENISLVIKKDCNAKKHYSLINDDVK